MERAQLGKTIRRVRLRNHLTQAEFARQMQVCQAIVSGWEQGTRRPNRSAFAKIAVMGRPEEAQILTEAAQDARPPRRMVVGNGSSEVRCAVHSTSIARASDGCNV